MAQKIGVLDHHQRQTDKPRLYLKKAAALLLVRRLLAEQLAHNLIRRIEVRDHPIVSAKEVQAPRFSYIPDRLPPAEVEGCVFKLKVSQPPTHLRLILLRSDERVL